MKMETKYPIIAMCANNFSRFYRICDKYDNLIWININDYYPIDGKGSGLLNSRDYAMNLYNAILRKISAYYDNHSSNDCTVILNYTSDLIEYLLFICSNYEIGTNRIMIEDDKYRLLISITVFTSADMLYTGNTSSCLWNWLNRFLEGSCYADLDIVDKGTLNDYILYKYVQCISGQQILSKKIKFHKLMPLQITNNIKEEE